MCKKLNCTGMPQLGFYQSFNTIRCFISGHSWVFTLKENVNNRLYVENLIVSSNLHIHQSKISSILKSFLILHYLVLGPQWTGKHPKQGKQIIVAFYKVKIQ